MPASVELRLDRVVPAHDNGDRRFSFDRRTLAFVGKFAAAVAVFLLVASPAAAFSGAGVSGKLAAGGIKVTATKVSGFSPTGSGLAKTHTCQASERKAPKGVRTPAVVACEQPPRSEITLPSAAQSVASALSQLG
jgi:hypothetical protein